MQTMGPYYTLEILGSVSGSPSLCTSCPMVLYNLRPCPHPSALPKSPRGVL